MKVIFLDTPLAYFSSCGLVVDSTVDGKDNKEEETLEDAEGAFPSSELFEVRENIRLLLNTINEGEGDRVSLIRWKEGRGAIEADEIRESRENVKESNRFF